MNHRIVKIDKENYSRFDDMVFWRLNGIERLPSKEAVKQSIINELDDPNGVTPEKVQEFADKLL
jgi:hypothetical protein